MSKDSLEKIVTKFLNDHDIRYTIVHGRRRHKVKFEYNRQCHTITTNARTTIHTRKISNVIAQLNRIVGDDNS